MAAVDKLLHRLNHLAREMRENKLAGSVRSSISLTVFGIVGITIELEFERDVIGGAWVPLKQLKDEAKNMPPRFLGFQLWFLEKTHRRLKLYIETFK
eukprot:g77543.t1